MNNDLEFRAKAGDLAAMTELGRRWLLGERALEGAALLGTASQGGSADASLLVAVLLGAGACTAQNWPSAFDYLTRAARLGLRSARRQMALLTNAPELAATLMQEPPADLDFWRALRASIDIERWLAPPEANVLSQNPRILSFEAMAAPAHCAWLIECAAPRLAPARLYDPDSGGPRSGAERSNREIDFDITRTDLILLLLRARIAAAAKVPATALESSNVLHYAVGQRFERHYDFLDPAVPGFARDVASRGQRVQTCLVYLSADYEGGETEFPLAGIRHKGAIGSALLFHNLDAGGLPDRHSLHAGLPPDRGEKWLLSQFVRGPKASA